MSHTSWRARAFSGVWHVRGTLSAQLPELPLHELESAMPDLEIEPELGVGKALGEVNLVLDGGAQLAQSVRRLGVSGRAPLKIPLADNQHLTSNTPPNRMGVKEEQFLNQRSGHGPSFKRHFLPGNEFAWLNTQTSTL